MPDKMAAQLNFRAFPPPQRFGGRWQPGSETEGMKEPVGIEIEEIFAIAFLSILERPVKKPHLVERKGLRLWIQPYQPQDRHGFDSKTRQLIPSGGNS